MKKKIKHIDLCKIEDPKFLRDLSKKELNVLANDIREFIIESISKTGGHLSSNLGVVELTIALHYIFGGENDKIIFDVGHQIYTHKILTGRAKDFDTLRKFNGLSGFASYSESKYDAWEAGHSSTSISALEGFLTAKDNGEDIGECVAVIGDASIASGVAFEALNHLGSKKSGSVPIIILNDNKMSISRSVGSLNKTFNSLRSNKFLRGVKRFIKMISIVPIRNFFHKMYRSVKSLFQYDNIFETLGYDYFGPIDGNNISDLLREIKRAKKLNKPCVIHVLTTKGKGYSFAENDKSGKYHIVPPFDIKSGKPLTEKLYDEYTYTEVVLKTIVKLKEEYKNLHVIDPAMVLSDDIDEINKLYPNFVEDVGISEEHAASYAASLALNNQKVMVFYYSTFIQRAYDEILNDIARQNRDVILGVDRCGIIGPDGSTHQGIYDISMLSGMPNMKICMGMNAKETIALVRYAVKNGGPIAIRYKKATDFLNLDLEIKDIDVTWTKILDGKTLICITYGPDVVRIKNIIIENKLSVTLINARFIKPMDYKMLDEIFETNLPILVYEEVIKSGSLYQNIVEYAYKMNKHMKIKGMNIDTDTIIKHGELDKVREYYHMSDNDILKELTNIYED